MCVYLIVAENGLTKIGRARNPKARFSTILSSSPIEIALIATVDTEDDQYLEEELHRQFSSCQVKGEWFALDQYDWQDLIRLCVLKAFPGEAKNDPWLYLNETLFWELAQAQKIKKWGYASPISYIRELEPLTN